jgi:hypothetical protein
MSRADWSNRLKKNVENSPGDPPKLPASGALLRSGDLGEQQKI